MSNASPGFFTVCISTLEHQLKPGAGQTLESGDRTKALLD